MKTFAENLIAKLIDYRKGLYALYATINAELGCSRKTSQ